LDAETESEIKLHTLPGCMTLCDLKNDNYYKLVAADIPLDFEGKSKLKVSVVGILSF
jgi:Bardet-Biedl syndrome 1 protein